MAKGDQSPESLARFTFLVTMAGAVVAIGVAIVWILL